MKAIVISNNCPYCGALRDFLEKKGLLDKVKFINADTKEGFEFAEKHGIKGVPECVVIEENGKQVKVCGPDEFKKLLKEGT